MVGVALSASRACSTELRVGGAGPGRAPCRGGSTDPARGLALQTALDRLTGGRHTDHDAPDAWVTALRVLPALSARYAPFPDGISEPLRDVLGARGITELYTHQAVAIEHALARRNVVITTPTASGKTLCYNAPVLNAILRDPAAHALYLFPTKALAQDQLAELQEVAELLATGHDARIGVFTYDGDTPQDARKAIRGRAHIVLSNPDMLHSGVLPHHPRWAKLFENLRYVVIDELHSIPRRVRQPSGQRPAAHAPNLPASTARIPRSSAPRQRLRTRASSQKGW